MRQNISARFSTQQLAEKLTEELLKDFPDEKTVKTYFSQLGLPDAGDSLARMEMVLNYLKSEINANKSARRRKQNEESL